MPTAVPIQCVDVTTPNVPSISGLVVNAPGFMLDKIASSMNCRLISDA